jgi:ribosomal protein S17
MAKSVVVKPTQYSYRTKSGGIVTRTRKAHVRNSPKRRARR